ncbi:hypothetical protein K0M31_000383, partial [Melipona bicolor]
VALSRFLAKPPGVNAGSSRLENPRPASEPENKLFENEIKTRVRERVFLNSPWLKIPLSRGSLTVFTRGRGNGVLIEQAAVFTYPVGEINSGGASLQRTQQQRGYYEHESRPGI